MRASGWLVTSLAASFTLSGCITIANPNIAAVIPTEQQGVYRTPPPVVRPSPEPEKEPARLVSPPPRPLPSRAPNVRPSPTSCFEGQPRASLPAGPSQGRYQGSLLPTGYRGYASEAAVTAALRREEGGPNWPCFQRFYPGAIAVYLQIRQELTAGPEPFPVPPPPPISGRTVIVSGTVHDERGATVNGATVVVKSLDSSVPYTAMVTTTEGSYVVNNVPEGANVEVVVTREGWTSRRRVLSFTVWEEGRKNIANFGGGADEYGDTTGAAYFISDLPEIVGTSPEHDARNVDGAGLSYKVMLSEALDDDSREAFEQAFAIVPTSNASAVDETGRVKATLDVAALERSGEPLAGITRARFPYVLERESRFLDAWTSRMRASWNAAGTEVTFTFGGNLQAGSSEDAQYQAMLFTPADPIEDANGNRLGTDSTGASRRPSVGELLCNAFKDADLWVDGNPETAWAQTHTSAAMFEVRPDQTDPKLAGVAVVEDGPHLRLDLSFSEPMAAFVGAGKAKVDPSVFDLSRYAFMLGERAGDLANRDLDGPYFGPGGGPASSLRSRLIPLAEFKFEHQPGPDYTIARGGDLAANANADVAIEVEPDAPETVVIWFRNGARDEMLSRFRVIKARVAGVKDPAGNVISEADADQNQVTATF